MFPIYAQSYLCSEKGHWAVIPQRVVKRYLGELGMGPVTGFAPLWQTAVKPLPAGHWMCGTGVLPGVGGMAGNRRSGISGKGSGEPVERGWFLGGKSGSL